MLLLISDANILIDIEVGGLTARMFSLEDRFALPDVLFYQELEDQHGYLREMGVEVLEVDELAVARFEVLAQRYQRPSRMDLFALALAMRERCALLTGDKCLRAAAEQEQIQVHGSLWLVAEMLLAGTVTPHVARSAFQRMR